MMQPADQPGSHPASGTSPSLLVRVQADEPAAWERLVGLYAPLVLHWCRRAGLADADIDDVFQEVFLAVATHIGNFRKDRSSDTFRGWLRTITHSKIVDLFRRRGRDPLPLGSGAALLADEADASLGSSPADQRVERGLFRRGLEQIRNEFEERTWQAFWGTTVEGRPAKEVAESLHMSAGSVRVAKCRVLHRLRAELGDLLD